MPVALTRSYGAFPAGSIVSLPPSTENAIVAQNIGNFTGATVSSGTISSNEFAGRAAIAAGATSVTVNNPNVSASSRINGRIALAVADGTLTGPLRIVPAAGSFTIYGNAAATGVVPIDWDIATIGLTPNN